MNTCPRCGGYAEGLLLCAECSKGLRKTVAQAAKRLNMPPLSDEEQQRNFDEGTAD